MSGIIIAAVVVSCTGLLLGLFLGVMGKKFYVEVCLLYTSDAADEL